MLTNRHLLDSNGPDTDKVSINDRLGNSLTDGVITEGSTSDCNRISILLDEIELIKAVH